MKSLVREREGKKERERESCNEKVIFRPASSPISFRHLVVAVVIVFDFVFSRFLCSKLPPRSSTLQNGWAKKEPGSLGQGGHGRSLREDPEAEGSHRRSPQLPPCPRLQNLLLWTAHQGWLQEGLREGNSLVLQRRLDQCDQIGRFLKVLMTNYFQKVAKSYGYFLDLSEKHHLKVKTTLATLRHLLETFGLLFISTSGYPGFDPHWFIFFGPLQL